MKDSWIIFFFLGKWARIVWDLYFICLAITYQVGFFIIPAYQTLANALPVASAAAVLLEQVRFTLKTYSFLRTVIPRVIFCKSHELGCSCMSSMSKYFYFLLAPTLIYKDEYPRYVMYYSTELTRYLGGRL